MSWNKLFSAFAERYVSEHWDEICDAVIESLDVDMDEVASAIAEIVVDSDLYEAIANEFISRM